ncbi:MAG TPA: serine/threonine-protein kinase [Solirubrobacterales bacterium]|nr:serine/threonine-protein kinase [Solirubrobacterales bacterium]
MSGAISKGAVLKERYLLERLLGRGGMASVWLGHDENLDRPVAIKVLSDTIAADPEFVARFRREARVAAGLSHPNLVGVYDYAEEGERPYLVMELVPGDDLKSAVSRGTAVDCEKVARELLSAVAHIHAAGILHRDIKPENILITPDGVVKLIDFGIALPRDATSLTQTGLVLGTKRYAAPEVMEGSPATERSDLYSCGVVLRGCGGERSTRLRPLADWLASADPASRPASARQALARLERRAADGQPTQSYTPVFVHPPSEPPSRLDPSGPPPRRRPPPKRRRARWVAAAAAVLAVLAFAVSGALSGNDGGSGPTSRAQGGKRGGERSRPVERRSGSEEPATAEATEASSTATTAPEPVGEDPELGSALNQEGFELIEAGLYEEAVPVLERAVRAFPAGTEDADYAYALFNLGNALRLSGRPEEAIPILERRLEIPNQTEVVQRELDLARQEAG